MQGFCAQTGRALPSLLATALGAPVAAMRRNVVGHPRAAAFSVFFYLLSGMF